MLVAPDNPMTARQQVHDCWNRIGVRGDHSCVELEQHIHCRNCPVYSAAARALLQVPLPVDHLGFWTRHLAQPVSAVRTDTQAVLVFKVGTEWLALPALRCVEVVEMRPIHTLPQRRNETVLGVVNVRGTLLPCVSLSAILHIGAESATNSDVARNGVDIRRLVVLSHTAPVVIRVDEVHGVQRASTAEMQQTPTTVRKGNATYIKAVLTLPGKTVGLLDAELLHYTIERSLA